MGRGPHLTLARLEAMSPAELRAAWARRHGTPVQGLAADRDGGIELILDPRALGLGGEADDWPLLLPLPARRPFREARLCIDAGADAAQPINDANHELLLLLVEAQGARDLVLRAPGMSIAAIAHREGRCRTRLARLVRLSWLAPKIVEAIADGSVPRTVTRKMLLNTPLPLDWHAQEQMLGL